ncbi:MAG: type II toxin-antitoxin system HicA family toxin [Pirellulaceae bacterium]|nr:type II toxin-antitoxin system HicA family toxin [Pirellulaceae bacterium]
MPRKIRELLADLKAAGFEEIPGGKGSHRKLTHPRYHGVVTLSGTLGDDAKPYISGEASAPSYRGDSTVKPSDRYHKKKWSPISHRKGVPCRIPE